MKEVVGEKEWGDFASQIIDHMGKNPATELFSADRYLTSYNKLSQAAKQQYFGAAKPHLDDIATISKKFGELSSKFNRSNTGIVNAVLKILNNPAAIGAHVATAAVNPMAAVTIGTQLGGLAAGRRVAWTLARPSSAQKAANVMRAYYGVARAAGQGVESVAKREQALASSIRAFSQEAARETGAKAKDIEANLTNEIKEASGTWTSKTISVDEMEAAIVEMTQGPDGVSIAELRRKFPAVSKAEFDRTLKEMREIGKVEFGGRKDKK